MVSLLIKYPTINYIEVNWQFLSKILIYDHKQKSPKDLLVPKEILCNICNLSSVDYFYLYIDRNQEWRWFRIDCQVFLTHLPILYPTLVPHDPSLQLEV